jgi:putative tricarboxylic transport membrane protein
MPGQRFGPAWFPGLAAAGLGLCGALLLGQGLRARGAWISPPDWLQRAQPRAAVASVLLGLLLYILLAERLGFHIVASVLLALWMRVLGARWRIAIVVSLAATVAIHLAFYKAMRVPLPWGLLEAWAF